MMRWRILSIFILSILVVLFAFSCADTDDDDDDTGDDDTSSDDDDSGDDDDTGGEVTPIIELVMLDGAPTAPNPVTGADTSADQEKIGFLRIRADTGDEPPMPVSSVLLLAAGHTIGGGEFRYIGKEIVRLSGGRIEVWSQERRSHFLEENWGLEIAEQHGNPLLAWDYYFEGLPVEGRTFAGFMDARGPETEMMSEWDLNVEMMDIERIISLLPEGTAQTNMFLGGHSRGVAFAEAYAAYGFPDGHRGTEDLAGLVLIDGGVREGGPQSVEEYMEEVHLLRTGEEDRFKALPLEGTNINLPLSQFGAPLYVTLEIACMAAADGLSDPADTRLGPDGIFPHDHTLRYLFWISNGLMKATVTNEALVGYLIDDESGLIELLNGWFGTITGGETEIRNGRTVLTDPSAVYSWIRSDEMDPREDSNIQALLWGVFEGPTNTMDRYYSARWDLDLSVAGYKRFETTGDWRDQFFNMRTSLVDAPVYAIGTNLLSSNGEYEAYRDQLAPVRGSDLPRTEAGFKMMYFPEWSHLDPILQYPDYNYLYPDLVNWLLENSTGEVQIPRM